MVTDYGLVQGAYAPVTRPKVIKPGEKSDLSDSVTKIGQPSEDTCVEDTTPEGSIDVNRTGEYTGILNATYPDGSEETINVKVIIR